MGVSGELRQGDYLVEGSGPTVKRYVVRDIRVRPGGKTVVHLAEQDSPNQDDTILPEDRVRASLNRDPVFDKRDAG